MWDLEETLQIAHQAGIADDKIILDPGVGFGKTYEHNLEIIAAALHVSREIGMLNLDLIASITGITRSSSSSAVTNENIACCLMHNRKEAVYQNYMEEVLWDLEETLQIAHQAGLNLDLIASITGITRSSSSSAVTGV